MATIPQNLTFDLLIIAETILLLWIKNKVVEQKESYWEMRAMNGMLWLGLTTKHEHTTTNNSH